MEAGFIIEWIGQENQSLCIRFRDPICCISKEMSAREKMTRADGGKGSRHLLPWPWHT